MSDDVADDPEPEHCHEPGPMGPWFMCEKPKGHKGKWHSCTMEVLGIGGGSTTTRIRWRVLSRVLGPRFN